MGIGWLIVKTIMPRMPHKRLRIKHGKVVLEERRRPRPTKIPRTPAKVKQLKAGRTREVRWKAWKMQDATLIKGPDVLITSKLTDEGRNLVGLIPAFGEDVKKMYYRVYRQMYNWIRDKQILYVPKDTGKLRRSIMRYLSHTKKEIENYQLNVYLGTVVPYAAWVNDMPIYPTGGTKKKHKTNYPSGSGPHIRHPPYVGGYIHGKKGNRLDDPKAVHHFWGFILANTRKIVPKMINAEIVILYKKWKKVFGWTHWKQCHRLFLPRYL